MKNKMKRTLLTILAGLLSVNLSAELPKVNQEDMHWVIVGNNLSSPSIITGYDTDGDEMEDTRFHYLLYPLPNGVMQSILTSYGVDLNRDKFFTEDEWFSYVPNKKRNENNKRQIKY